MVMLHESDIQTKEVLKWTGVHLFHFSGSSCSQKLRIFLRLKGIEWHSHHINLARRQHTTPYYMGINPRGLVPTLVHNGQVCIESNDILLYLEQQFPEPALMPAEEAEAAKAMLRAEDDLHLDLRALTMRFVFPTFLTKRPEKELVKYEALGSGTVEGMVDPDRQRELTFWRDMLRDGGITDVQTRTACNRFSETLSQFDRRLEAHRFLIGENVSIVDIAWYIYIRRLLDAGFLLGRSHPNVGRWFAQLDSNPIFHEEVPSGGIIGAITKVLHFAQRIHGTDFNAVITR